LSFTEIDMSRKRKPVSPGAMLVEEFLKPLGMSNDRLAKEVGVPTQPIGEIPAGKRAIIADTRSAVVPVVRAWIPRGRAARGNRVGRVAAAQTGPETSVGQASVF
jgi:hypothetical protein